MSYPKIMYDNLPIAEIKERSIFMYLPNVKESVRVPSLNRLIFTWREFFDWVKRRIPPIERTDLDKLLVNLNVTHYSIMGIAEKTNASLMEDPYWIAFTPEEENAWREKTIRGAAGYPEVGYADIYN